MENVNVFQIIMPKKAAFFSSKAYAVDYFRNLQEISGLEWQFSGENQRFMDAKRPDTASMLYRQIVMATSGPFANPLREDLDVHHIVQINPTPYPFS